MSMEFLPPRPLTDLPRIPPIPGTREYKLSLPPPPLDRPRDRTAATWKVANLQPHPLQTLRFRPLSDSEFNALRESMALEGLLEPLKILPNGTILSGHHRARAALELGWDEIQVVVVRDTDAHPELAELELIKSNLNRRHATALDLVRSQIRAWEIEQPSIQWSQSVLVEKLLPIVRKSPKQIRRYISIAKADPSVIQAIDSGLLDPTNAEKIAKQPKLQQQQLMARIHRGEEARQIVASIRKGGTKPDLEPMARIVTDLVKASKACAAIRGGKSDADQDQKDWLYRLQAICQEALDWVDESERRLKRSLKGLQRPTKLTRRKPARRR
jgi:ParB family chromosome partitioning protein